MSRERLLALALVALGGVIALAAAGRPWSIVTSAAAPGLPRFTDSIPGSDVAGSITALGLAGLACTAALVATRGRLRQATGAVGLVVGVGIVVASWAGARVRADLGGGTADVHHTAWPWVAAAGGVLLVVGGGLALLRGARWPGLDSRYDPPAPTAGHGTAPAAAVRSPAAQAGGKAGGQAATSDRDLWAALDRGEDPTAGSR